MYTRVRRVATNQQTFCKARNSLYRMHVKISATLPCNKIKVLNQHMYMFTICTLLTFQFCESL
jgi:hypothetical protein